MQYAQQMTRRYYFTRIVYGHSERAMFVYVVGMLFSVIKTKLISRRLCVRRAHVTAQISWSRGGSFLGVSAIAPVACDRRQHEELAVRLVFSARAGLGVLVLGGFCVCWCD